MGPELAWKGEMKGHPPGNLKASSATGSLRLLIYPYVFPISSVFSCLSHIFSPFSFIAMRHKTLNYFFTVLKKKIFPNDLSFPS